MLGRQVGGALLRFPVYARLPLRPSPFQCPTERSSRALLLSVQRYYATGRPKKAVGEPSKPVKRAVKRAAKSPATGEAGEKVKAKKAVATKKKTVAGKKAAPKTPVKKAKKILTPEQTEAKKARTEDAKIKAMKKAALSPPSGTNVTAYNIFLSEGTKKSDSAGKSSVTSVREAFINRADEWKARTPAQVEHYNHIARAETEKRQAEHKRWVESHTPEQIREANRVRMSLRRKFQSTTKNTRKWSQIPDERAVKRPVSAYLQFYVNRLNSGDFKNIPVPESSKLVAKEWKELGEGEKKKYVDLTKQDSSRYAEERQSVYSAMPSEPRVQAAAAA